MSRDARYVVFQTGNTFELPDDNFASDVFVRDRLFGTTIRVSENSAGEQAEPFHAVSGLPDVSADGQYVIFYSRASNLVPNDTNDLGDIFGHDVVSGTTSRVSVSAQGDQANGETSDASVSADGRYVAFESIATNLVPSITTIQQVYVRDLLNATTLLASTDSFGHPANELSFEVGISANGRYVVFVSRATNLVPGATLPYQIYRHDMLSGTTVLVSAASSGEQGNSFNEYPVISADGRYVAFQSASTNLVANDKNNKRDIFLHDCDNGTTRRMSVDDMGREGNEDAVVPAISADGQLVVFTSGSTNWHLHRGVYSAQGYSVFAAPVSIFDDGFD
jgi:Tol biopolymer transport system component